MDGDTRQYLSALCTILAPYLAYVALLTTAGLIEVYTFAPAGWPFLAAVPVYWFTGWLASLMFRNWLAGRKELVHAR